MDREVSWQASRTSGGRSRTCSRPDRARLGDSVAVWRVAGQIAADVSLVALAPSAGHSDRGSDSRAEQPPPAEHQCQPPSGGACTRSAHRRSAPASYTRGARRSASRKPGWRIVDPPARSASRKPGWRIVDPPADYVGFATSPARVSAGQRRLRRLDLRTFECPRRKVGTRCQA